MFWNRTEASWRGFFAPEGGTGGGGGGEGGGEWTAGLSESARGVVEANGFKSADAAIMAYSEAQKLIGGTPDQLVRLPGRDATDADYEAFYGKLGRPATPEDYKFADREKADEQIDKMARAEAHRLGLNERQANALRERQYSLRDAANKAFDEKLKADITKVGAELLAKHGDRYPAVQEFTRRGAEWLSGGDEALLDLIEEAGLFGNQAFVERLAKLGENASEDGKLLGGGGGGGGSFGAMSPAAAQAEIGRLLADPEFLKPYQDRSNPGHKAAVERMTALTAAAYPQKPAA